MMRFFKPKRSAFVVAAAALLSLNTGRVDAQVIVAEDFLYQQESNVSGTFTSANKFLTQDYAGGQNGIGAWDERWTGFGSGGIISDDLVAEPWASNPFTASVDDASNGSNGSEIAREYSFADAATTDTLWFAADFLLPNGDSANNYASFSPITSIAGRDPAFVPALAIGIRDGTFFGSIGDTQVTGDIGTPADNITDMAFHRVVGKLEIGVGSVFADYNSDGVTNAADYSIYRDTLGSTTDLRADGDGSGTIDQADYDLWASGFNNNLDRLTVMIDPTDADTSAGSTLVIEGEAVRNLIDGSGVLQAVATGVDPLNVNGASNPHIVDNVVVGLTFDDVAAVEVPRLSAEVGAGGEVSLVNNTSETFEIAYYELESANGELTPDGWNSLQDQATAGWAENAGTAELIVESNFTEILAIGPGESVALGAVANGTTDLIVRYGELEGDAGLLNLAPVSAAAAAVPEPSAVALLAIAALGVIRKRG